MVILAHVVVDVVVGDLDVLAGQIEGCCWLPFDREKVFIRDNLIERANGNLSHKTPRSKTGSRRVEGSRGGGSYN